MSRILINQYYTNLDRAVQFGKSKNEQSIRNYFWNLLNEYAHKQNYEVVTEVTCQGTKGAKVRPDGIIKNSFGLDIGLWESKDEKDTIDDEINSKQKKGYPFTNILFEDSQTAVLFQRGEEILRGSVRNPDELHNIITKFISFKSDIIYKFEDALEKFKSDIPAIVETLRTKIDQTRIKNKNFISVSETFLELCKVEINPDITEADIREMMIQHILTSDIFNKIFDDPEFHRHNNIARELEKLIEILFTYGERKNLMANIEHYYDAINSTAAAITDHHEKQKFLKVLYENFYKVYNPKAADRLGVVYTPNEIVKFMIESTDFLLHKHFGKTLADKNVEILDPATGTGTFITSIIDHIPNHDLLYKYKNEIHANEVAILPYYIANLNVEFTFKQKMGFYEEFKNLCFVDTLDNTTALNYAGKQENIFGLSSENSERIKRQNSKKISVIIGNPPYNANQLNENENNKNREYPILDKRIKETYIKHSTAQKTKVYDMYARFYRWASDRLEKNGILAFITNRSFIDSRTFDGFRKNIFDDFSACYIIDTKSDVRANPKIAGTTHNVFGIQTGVAIMFLVKKENEIGKCEIKYSVMEDNWRKEEKLDWLRTNKLQNISFEKITPDKNNNWINLADNDFEELIPLATKETKLSKKKSDEKAVFKLFTLGTVSNRDEWVYSFDQNDLKAKIEYFIKIYLKDIEKQKKAKKSKQIFSFNSGIKYTRDLKKSLLNDQKIELEKSEFRNCLYRAFVKKEFYYAKELNEMRYQTPLIFPNRKSENILFAINLSTKAFNILGSKYLVDLHFNGDSQCFPLYIFDEKGNKTENITDWGLEQFQKQYSSVIAIRQSTEKQSKITKEDIFNYVYAVLHNSAYRKKYELNLKREFPRIPFYKDFWQWSNWGKTLMELHINYENAKPYNLKVVNKENKEFVKEQKEIFQIVEEPKVLFEYKPKIKVKLKADKENGTIEIDENTTIKNIPKEAWEYKLGNRSAIEWILDQYKEKKPKDPTIAEKFNTYKFADYKEIVIELIKKVTTVSVETVKVVKEMEKQNSVYRS
ncbi:MAG: N-6 DNA methylase [Ignavibacteriae bacterium]|nr:N-6 DNA methylase [Ignavibacteriota bacterium]